MLTMLIIHALIVWIFMSIIFIIAMVRKDNSIVDVAWGLGFILIALVSFFWKRGFVGREMLVTGLILAWGLRLAAHIFLRNRSRDEDFRYAAWRKQWGKWFVPRSYLQVFMLQGFLMLGIAFPVILINHSRLSGLTVLDGLGFCVWLVGFFFEAVGDYQLQVFKRGPKNQGRIMTSGLWSLTRHPNYFGEVAMWWGIFLLAVSVPQGWAALISPVLITFLLLRVSGIPMLEKKYAGNEAFAAYTARTRAFFPWFPRKK